MKRKHSQGSAESLAKAAGGDPAASHMGGGPLV